MDEDTEYGASPPSRRRQATPSTTCDCSRSCLGGCLRNNALMCVTIGAIIVGLVLGFGLRPLDLSQPTIAWLSIWGELFMRMLKLIILPICMSCLVVGVASLDSNVGGRLGAVTLGYIIITQVIGVVLGIVLAITVRPGVGFGDPSLPPVGTEAVSSSYTDIFTDLLRNIVPDNVVRMCIESAYTSVEDVATSSVYNSTLNMTTFVRNSTLMYRDRMNTLGVVMFSMVLGAAIAMAGDKGKPLLVFFTSLQDVIFKVMKIVIWYSPLGIASLITGALLNVVNMTSALKAVGIFVITSVSGCFVHEFIILPLLYLLIVRKNPYKFFVGILDAVLAGTAPPSSAASLPYYIQSFNEKFKYDRRVVNFAAPIMSTLNRDGSALFICLASIFVAQTYDIELGADKVVILGILVTLLVAAAASIPSSSIVVLMMVSSSLGIPLDNRLGLLLAVEWITDRSRSSANIASHGYGVAIVEKLCRTSLQRLPSPEPSSDEIKSVDKESMEVIVTEALLQYTDKPKVFV